MTLPLEKVLAIGMLTAGVAGAADFFLIYAGTSITNATAFRGPTNAYLAALHHTVVELNPSVPGAVYGDNNLSALELGCDKGSQALVCQAVETIHPHLADNPSRTLVLWTDGPTNDLGEYSLADDTVLYNRMLDFWKRSADQLPAGRKLNIVTSTIFPRNWTVSPNHATDEAWREAYNDRIRNGCRNSQIVRREATNETVYRCGAGSFLGTSYPNVTFRVVDTAAPNSRMGDDLDYQDSRYFAWPDDTIPHPNPAGYDIQAQLAATAIADIAGPGLKNKAGKGCAAPWAVDTDCGIHGVLTRAGDEAPAGIATLLRFLLLRAGSASRSVAFLSLATNTPPGDDSTACVWTVRDSTCDPYNRPFATTAALGGALTSSGALVVVRGGIYSQPLIQPGITPSALGVNYGPFAASRTDPLVYLAYPGEAVVWIGDGRGIHEPAAGDTIFDGFIFAAPDDSPGTSCRNCEFADRQF